MASNVIKANKGHSSKLRLKMRLSWRNVFLAGVTLIVWVVLF